MRAANVNMYTHVIVHTRYCTHRRTRALSAPILAPPVLQQPCPQDLAGKRFCIARQHMRCPSHVILAHEELRRILSRVAETLVQCERVLAHNNVKNNALIARAADPCFNK